MARVGCFEDTDMKTNQKIYDLKEYAVARSRVYTGIQLFTMVIEIFFFPIGGLATGI